MPTSATANAGEGDLRARTQNACFVCGKDNANGLQLEYRKEPDGSFVADWVPAQYMEGFAGIVHGGLISTVLDEAMAKAVAALECEALTGELRVRFRQHVSSGDPVRVRGWVTESAKRMLRTEATLTAADGTERAHAWASFLRLAGSASRDPQPGGRDEVAG
jgi:acyl-coenzyme A thioesterase PaaI-like protein